MKKLGFLFPVLIFFIFTIVGNRMFASGQVTPSTLIIVAVVMMLVMMLARPKKTAAKPVSDIEQKVRGEFAKNAFADNSQLDAKFQSALKDYSSNMPKSCMNKLTKLAPQCTAKEETYAVAMATAMCALTLGKPQDAIREYTRALTLNPTSQTAIDLGSCHQRLGQLSKARDSYEYALELDPENIEARSAIATTYVADGYYEDALEQAQLVLDKNENHASALATTAICYGVMNDPVMAKHFTDCAVENGYKKDKIEQTISALKKRDK